MCWKQLTFFLLIILFGCSSEFYENDNKKYRIYKRISPLKNKGEVHAIDLSNQFLKDFPKEIGEVQDLVFLNLKNNDITILNEELCKHTRLKVLLLNGNSIGKLPDCVYELSELEVLTLFGCRIDISKEGLAKLVNLKILGIGGNHFTEEDVIYLRERLPHSKIILAVD